MTNRNLFDYMCIGIGVIGIVFLIIFSTCCIIMFPEIILLLIICIIIGYIVDHMW